MFNQTCRKTFDLYLESALTERRDTLIDIPLLLAQGMIVYALTSREISDTEFMAMRAEIDAVRSARLNRPLFQGEAA
jgi:hypothetical protein